MQSFVTAFVHRERDLEINFPFLKRWLRAELRGFIADCSKPGMPSACKRAEDIALLTTIYVMAADNKLRNIGAPGREAAYVPLKSSTQ